MTAPPTVARVRKRTPPFKFVPDTLRALPHAVRVSTANADGLWTARKRHFFKPAAGHASKAVYRGDKLTRGAWETILAGEYIAQELAAPSERSIRIDGTEVQGVCAAVCLMLRDAGFVVSSASSLEPVIEGGRRREGVTSAPR